MTERQIDGRRPNSPRSGCRFASTSNWICVQRLAIASAVSIASGSTVATAQEQIGSLSLDADSSVS
jgi:hypothetical protein